MNTTTPKISIIMAVYNERPIYLKKSIESILNQTYTNFEFLIINDNANSETSVILQEYAKKDSRIFIILNRKNIGLTKSLNVGIKKSHGRYIARMDSDDISLPNRLSYQLNFIKKTNIDLIGANCNIINSKDVIIKKRREPRPKNYALALFKKSLFAHSTFFGTKKVFKELYDENFKTAQDYEFLLRVCGKNYTVSHIYKPLLLYRINPNGISIKKVKQQDISAIKIRILAIIKFKYPIYYVIYILKPLLILLTPLYIQHLLLYKNQK